MSEAVVDDIVAVLPPLLQSLEALGFIARYLNPPDFDRVMATAGEPDAGPARRSAAARAMAGGFRAHQDAARNGQRCRARRVRSLAGRSKRPGRFRQPVSCAASYPARAGSPLRAVGKIAAGEPVLCRSRAARRRRSRGPVGGAGQREYRRLPQSQRARQPRRLLALRAGILHARPRMAAGNGAARRQRQRPQLSVELAARRPQPRRDPGRTDRYRQHLGIDGRGYRYAEPRAHPGLRPRTLERRSGPGCC